MNRVTLSADFRRASTENSKVLADSTLISTKKNLIGKLQLSLPQNCTDSLMSTP